MIPSRAATFAATATAIHAAHTVGDHWVQTHSQATDKVKPGPEGWKAVTAHVATYTATLAMVTLAADRGLGLNLRPGRVVAGLMFAAATHWVIDRREPLRHLAVATGHAGFVDLGVPRPGRDDNPTLGTGMYALDQAAHTACNTLAAAIMAGGR